LILARQIRIIFFCCLKILKRYWVRVNILEEFEEQVVKATDN
jgi:hypothetical protein